MRKPHGLSLCTTLFAHGGGRGAALSAHGHGHDPSAALKRRVNVDAFVSRFHGDTGSKMDEDEAVRLMFDNSQISKTLDLHRQVRSF